MCIRDSEFLDFIKVLNLNHCHAERLTDLATKAVLLSLTRVSAVVSMQWNWFDDQRDCWVIPSATKGLKRKKDDSVNDHLIPNTPQLETLMNSLSAINGNQKYVFFSPFKGNNPYLSKQTPNDHLINLKFLNAYIGHIFRNPFFIIVLLWYPSFETLFSIIRKNIMNKNIFFRLAIDPLELSFSPLKGVFGIS